MHVDIVSSYWDFFVDIASIISAVASAILVYVIYVLQKKDTEEQEIRNNDVEHFYNVFLSCRIEELNQFFNSVKDVVKSIMECHRSDEGKERINDRVGRLLSQFHYYFVSVLQNIDKTLYEGLRDANDKYRDDLSEYLVTDLSASLPEECVNDVLDKTNRWQSNVLSILIFYKGRNIKRPKRSKCHWVGCVGVFLLIVFLGYIAHACDKKSPYDSSPVIIKIDSTQMESIEDTWRVLCKDTIYNIPLRKGNGTRKRRASTKVINGNFKCDSIDANKLDFEIQLTDR